MHPTSDELHMFSTGEPSNEFLARIEQHLQECGLCALTVVELVRESMRSRPGKSRIERATPHVPFRPVYLSDLLGRSSCFSESERPTKRGDRNGFRPRAMTRVVGLCGSAYPTISWAGLRLTGRSAPPSWDQYLHTSELQRS
jgi:hypothetical protein